MWSRVYTHTCKERLVRREELSVLTIAYSAECVAYFVTNPATPGGSRAGTRARYPDASGGQIVTPGQAAPVRAAVTTTVA
jgi:hypothetical protein